jgi:hypothetical protein
MLFPKYALEDLTIGSGSIIGKGNIEEFFNHVSMHKDVEDFTISMLSCYCFTLRFVKLSKRLLDWPCFSIHIECVLDEFPRNPWHV